MLLDILKKVIEQTADELIKGIDEISRTMEEASKPYSEKKSVQNSPVQKKPVKNSPVKEQKKPQKKHTNEDVRQGLQKFKMDMMRSKPFFGDILMRIPLIEDDNIPTACTNGRNIRYNPNFFKELEEGERNYVYMHEVYHILLLHWRRQSDRDQELWNICADWIVNAKLDRLKFSLPAYIKFSRPAQGCFADIKHREEYTEKLYHFMLKNTEKQSNGMYLYQKKYKIRLDIKDLDAPDKLSGKEARLCRKQIQELLKSTVKRRGLGDSMFFPREMISLVETKKLPWNRLLSDFLQEREDDESSYLSPERKYIHMDLIVPGIGKIDDKLGDIWAFVDSSGSIGGDELSQFMTQLYRVSKEFECNFNIAFWDTSVTDIYRDIRHKEQILKCMANHSGGTDINCVYEYIRENHIKPEVMIILTDGYFGSLREPDKKLRDRTILVISENGADIDENNDIGRLARL